MILHKIKIWKTSPGRNNVYIEGKFMNKGRCVVLHIQGAIISEGAMK